MIIFTGRFQPFHNGHLKLVEELIGLYPQETICIAIIKDVPLANPNEFDRQVDIALSKAKNVFDAHDVLKTINIVLRTRGLNNVLTTLMPRVSEDTWQIIVRMFDCPRQWVFTDNQESKDKWEEIKCNYYKSKGEEVVVIPILKQLNGSDIRALLENGDIEGLKNRIPEEIINEVQHIYDCRKVDRK